MKALASGARPPGPLLRWFFRAPLLLYRAGLGGLMFMQLELTTVGRKSGQPRRTVVDVLRHQEVTDTYYVVSAWGERADWYRNLQRNPAVRVQVARRTFRGRARTVPGEEAGEILVDFLRRHRLYVPVMFRLIGLRVDTEERMRQAAATMRVVAIQPESR